MAAPRFVIGDVFKVPMAIKKMERYSDKLKGEGKQVVKLTDVIVDGEKTTVQVISSIGENIILDMRSVDANKLLRKTDQKTVPKFAIKYVMYDGKRLTKYNANKLKARNKRFGIKHKRVRIETMHASSGNSNNEVNEAPKLRPPRPARSPTGPNPLQIATQKVNKLLDISMLKGLNALAFVEILKKLKKPTNLRNLANETKKDAEKMIENAVELELEAFMNKNSKDKSLNESRDKLKEEAKKLRNEAKLLKKSVNREIDSVSTFKVISSIPSLPKSVINLMLNILSKKHDGKGEPQLIGLAKTIAKITMNMIVAHLKERREMGNIDKRKLVEFDTTRKTNSEDTGKTKKSTKRRRKIKETNYKAPQKLPRPKIGLPSGKKRVQRGKRAAPVERAMNQNMNDSEWIPNINEDPSFENYVTQSTTGKPSPLQSSSMGYMVINDESILRVIRKRLLSRLDEINEIERYIKPYHDIFQASLFVNSYIMNGFAEDEKEDKRVSKLLEQAIYFLERSGTHGGGLVVRGLKQNKAIKGGEQITGLKTANFSVQLKSVIAETQGGRGKSLTYARTWLTRFGRREVRVGVGNNKTVRELGSRENTMNGEWVIGNTGTPDYRANPFKNAQTEVSSIQQTVIGMEYHPLWVVRGALGYRAWERVKDKSNANPEKRKLQTMIPVHPLCINPWTSLRSRISEKDKVMYQGTEYIVSGIRFVQSGKKREPIFELKSGNTRISKVPKLQIAKVHGIVKGQYAMLKENNKPVIIRNIDGRTAKVSLKSGNGFQFETSSVPFDINNLREMNDSDFAKLSDEFKSLCRQRQKVSKIKEKVLFHGFCARPQDANACSVKVPTDITSWSTYMTVFARNLVSTEVTNVNNTIDESSATTIERVACKSYKDCEIKCRKQRKVQCRGLAAIVNDEIETPFDSNDFGSVKNIKNDLQKKVSQIKLAFKPQNYKKKLRDLKLKVKESLMNCNRAKLRMRYFKLLPHVKNIKESEKITIRDEINKIETQQYNGQPVLSAEIISTIKRALDIDWTKKLDPMMKYSQTIR